MTLVFKIMWFCQFSVISSFAIFITDCVDMEVFHLDIQPEENVSKCISVS